MDTLVPAAASTLLLISVSYLSYKLLSAISALLRDGNSSTLNGSATKDPASPQWRRMFDGAVEYFTAINRKSGLGGYPQWMSGWIQKAGDPWRKDAFQILAYSEVAFIGVAAGSFIFVVFAMQSINVMLPLIFGGLAALVPPYMLVSAAQVRLVRINRGLPFALDLMILCMEAGSSFLEATEILVRSDPDNPLGQEFNFVLQSIRHGKMRRDALNEMAEKVGSADLAPVAAAINVGEELGTPVGQVLRIQRDGIRLKRTFRAEKLAGEASSKILFPSLLIMVAVLLMLVGPVIVSAVQQGWF